MTNPFRGRMWTGSNLAAVAAMFANPEFYNREKKDANSLALLESTNMTDPLLAMKGMKDSLKVFITGAIEQSKAHKDFLDTANKEIAANKTASADTLAKLTEMGTKMTGQFEEITKLQAGIKSLEAFIARPEFSGTDKDKSDKVTEDAMVIIKERHFMMAPGTPFDMKNYNVEDVKSAMKAFDRIMRCPAGQRHEASCSADELKSLNTISIEGYFFVKPAMSSRIIKCQTEYSEILDLFTSETISNASIQYMVDNDDEADGGWACEQNCNVTPSDLSKPGIIEIIADEIHKRICITHKMIEDAAVDMEAYAARKIARKFAKDINNAVITGSKPGMPQGILTYTGFNSINSGSVPGTPAGQFTWQDLVLEFYNLEAQWQANATWLMNRKTLGKMLTMADGEGRPIWTPQIIAQGGAPQIMGRPIRIVTQMPDVAVGSRPIAVGDWKEAYTVVNRLGLTTLRDPFTKAACGVVWTFRQRIGGGVTCPLAANFMLIR